MHPHARPWLLLAGVMVASACATAPAPRLPSSEGASPAPAQSALAPTPAPSEAPPPPPGLHFDVRPAEAQVIVDGQPVGTAASLRERGGHVELPPGIHQVVLKLPGYVTWRGEVAVSDRSEPIRVTLDPRP